MKCPKCSCKTQTKDSRPSGELIRRRHHCPDCGHRFTTFEMIFEAEKGCSPPKTFGDIYQQGIEDGQEQFVQAVWETLKGKVEEGK